MAETTEVRRSALATVLSHEKVLNAAQRIIDGEKRVRAAYAMPRTTVNQQDLTRELHYARDDVRIAREDLADAVWRCAQRIAQSEPIEAASA